MSFSRVLTVLFALAVGLACSSGSGGATEGAESVPSDRQPRTERGVSDSGLTAAEPSGAPESPDEVVAETVEERQDARPGVAVFPFVNGGSYGEDVEDLEALRVGLQQMLLTELDRNDELRIVERSMLKKIMEEQDLGTTDRVDPATAAKVGQIVGAQYMITGVFADLYGKFRIDARIIDTETSEIVQTTRVRGQTEELYGLLVDLANKITEGADLPSLPVAVREKRKERDIPAEAITLYSRAQVYQDRGYEERAIKVYRQIVDKFPEMEQARTALKQLGG